jgi:hypothetical protein
MSVICNQLKSDNTINDKWWSENDLDTPVPQKGRRKLNPPTDYKQTDALYYQICIKIITREIQFLGFCYSFTNCHVRETLPFFNKNIVKPLVRPIQRSLDEMKDISL